MKDTKIRWAGRTWNPMTGCTHITPGCDHCYAEVIANKFSGGPGSAFPNGFVPTFKPQKLRDPAKWRQPDRIFVNSMSDVHHEDFTDDQIDQVYDAMAETERHDYLVLTKRPQRMARFLLGSGATKTSGIVGDDGWLARHGLDRVPRQVWLGTTIEDDKFTFRADWLRGIPVDIRFLSCEPLIGPLPSLDLTGLAWVIVGGESGNGRKEFRVMDDEWARDLRDRCDDAAVAFYFKQHSGLRTELGIDLDGVLHEEYPLPHPAGRADSGILGPVPIARYLDADNGAPLTIATS
jgi:protein gp37